MTSIDGGGDFRTVGRCRPTPDWCRDSNSRARPTAGRGRITRRGPRQLRKMLVEAAWVMLRYNGWAQQIVQRIAKGQRTRKRQAVIALAQEVLVRCWAMVRVGVPWREPDPLPTY